MVVTSEALYIFSLFALDDFSVAELTCDLLMM